MESEARLALIQMALGKASVAFISQPTAGQVVMPTAELLEVAQEVHSIWTSEAEALAAKIRELRKDRRRLELAMGRGWININLYNGAGGWCEERIETRDELDEAIGPIDADWLHSAREAGEE